MKMLSIITLFCLSCALASLSAPCACRAYQAEESKRPWTLLVYGAVDNSADDPFVDFTDKVRRAIDNDPGIELVVFIDRSDNHRKRATYLGKDFSGSRLYRITKDSAERLAGGDQFPEITLDNDVNLNSSDASTLQRFLVWGKANFPAQHYALLIYSHADGETMCPDDRTKSTMGIAELTDEVGINERVDFLALELCNMGGLEIAYQWRPGNGGFEADVLLAIPNAGPPLDWDRAFARIRSPGHAAQGGAAIDPANMTAQDFGKLVIEEGQRGREAAHKRSGRGTNESAGCYDLSQSNDLKQAVDALAAALAESDAKDAFLACLGNQSNQPLITYSENGSYVDLHDLCRRLAKSDQLSEPVRSAAAEVMSRIDDFMIASFGMSGYAGFESGKNGVFIVVPSAKPNRWQDFSWYTPERGDDKNYGNWSFLRDGASPENDRVDTWYELLVAWFSDAGGDK